MKQIIKKGNLQIRVRRKRKKKKKEKEKESFFKEIMVGNFKIWGEICPF